MTGEPLHTASAATGAPDIAANLALVKARIVDAARVAGRAPDDITLVAVTKTHGPELVERAIAAGHRCFGENRVREAEKKWPALKTAEPEATLHLIGPLQTNKVAPAVALFDVIETIDRPKLARAVASEMEKTGREPECFIEVNSGEEAQKAGVYPADADALIAACREEHRLNVTGLMCIPPHDEEPSLHFALVREIARRNGLTKLSMGMSQDFEVAVAFGATHVRIGTAIFGPRQRR